MIITYNAVNTLYMKNHSDILLKLEDNWDSYGAAKPIQTVLKEAQHFIKIMRGKGITPYFIAPGPSGDIMVEYKNASGVEAEVHFRVGDERLLVAVPQSGVQVELRTPPNLAVEADRRGAGLGMVVCHNCTVAMFFDVARNRRTEVTGIFDLDLGQRDFRTLAKSLHFFSE